MPTPLSVPGRFSDHIVNTYMLFPCFCRCPLVVEAFLLASESTPPNQALWVPIQVEYDLQ